MKLAPHERGELAAALLASLESGDQAELEAMWVEEADRRFRAYRSGRDKMIPAGAAIESVRASLQR